jgi:hypothetical protein
MIGIGWAVAWAGPPEGVVPEDLERWERGTAALLAGPPGCWVLSGRGELVIAGLPSVTRSARGERREDRFVATFDGILEDGTWKSLAYTLVPQDDPGRPAEIDLPLLPTLGKFDPGTLQRLNPVENAAVQAEAGSEAAQNLVEEMFAELGSSTAYAQWRDDLGGIELLQDVSLDEARRDDPVRVRTFFPGGGDADRLDALFPRRVRVGEFPITARVYDLQLHLRTALVDGVRLPSTESISLAVAALGFTVGYEQTLVWERVAPCR